MSGVGVCLQRSAVFYIYPVDPDLCGSPLNNHKFASRGVYSGFIHNGSDGPTSRDRPSKLLSNYLSYLLRLYASKYIFVCKKLYSSLVDCFV